MEMVESLFVVQGTLLTLAVVVGLLAIYLVVEVYKIYTKARRLLLLLLHRFVSEEIKIEISSGANNDQTLFAQKRYIDLKFSIAEQCMRKGIPFGYWDYWDGLDLEELKFFAGLLDSDYVKTEVKMPHS